MVMIDKSVIKVLSRVQKALKSPINKGFKACLSHSHSTVAGGFFLILIPSALKEREQ